MATGRRAFVDRFTEACPFNNQHPDSPLYVNYNTGSARGLKSYTTGSDLRAHLDDKHAQSADFYKLGHRTGRYELVRLGVLPCNVCFQHVRAHLDQGSVARENGLINVVLQRHRRSTAIDKKSYTVCTGQQLTARQILILASQCAVDLGALPSELAGTYEKWEASYDAAVAMATRQAPLNYRPGDDPDLLDRFSSLFPVRRHEAAPSATAALACCYGDKGDDFKHDSESLEASSSSLPGRALPTSVSAGAGRMDSEAAAATEAPSRPPKLSRRQTQELNIRNAARAVHAQAQHLRSNRSERALASARAMRQSPRPPAAEPAETCAASAAAASGAASASAAPTDASRGTIASVSAAIRAASEASIGATLADAANCHLDDNDGEMAPADSSRAIAAEQNEEAGDLRHLLSLLPSDNLAGDGEIGAEGRDVNAADPPGNTPPDSVASSAPPSPPPERADIDEAAGAGAALDGDGNIIDAAEGDDDDDDGLSLPPAANFPMPALGGTGVPSSLPPGHSVRKSDWAAAVRQTIITINGAFNALGKPDFPKAASAFNELLCLAPQKSSGTGGRINIKGPEFLDNIVNADLINPVLPDAAPAHLAAPDDAGGRAINIKNTIRSADNMLLHSRFGDAGRLILNGPPIDFDFDSKPAQEAINALHPLQAADGFPSADDLVFPPSPYGVDGSITPDTMPINPDTAAKFHINLDNYDLEIDGARAYVDHLALATCPLLAKLLGGHKRSTGRGIDGWSYESVCAAFVEPADPAAAIRGSHLAPLAELLLHIISGKTSVRRFRHLLYRFLRGKALRKPNGKPRPLGIPSVFIRLAHSFALRLFQAECHAATDPQDLGCKPSGCEALARFLQITLNKPNGAVNTTDGHNAFNNINAQSALNVGLDVPGLVPSIINVAGRERDIVYLDKSGAPAHVIHNADRGVVAGDPLGTWLFNIAASTAVADVRAEAAKRGVSLPSIHDDFNIAAPSVKDAFLTMHDHKYGLKTTGESIGIFQNIDKTYVVTINSDAASLAEAAALAAAHGVKLNTDGFVAGGIPVGTSAFIIKSLDESKNEIIDYIRAILDLARENGAMPSHAAFGGPGEGYPIGGAKGALQRVITLLRLTAAPKFMHLIRGVDPALTKGPARQIDDAIFDAVLTLLGHPAHTRPPVGSEHYEAVYARVFLPISRGGLGFLSLLNSRLPAYIASCQATAHLIHNCDPTASFIDGSDIRLKIPGLAAAYEELATPANGLGGPDSLAAKLAWFDVDKHAPHKEAGSLQSRLMRAGDKARHAALLAAASPHAKLLLLSAGDHHAGAYIHCSGGNKQLTMFNDDWAIATSYRLGLSVVGSHPPPPVAGAAAAPPPAHYNASAETRPCPFCPDNVAPMCASGAHAFLSGTCPKAAATSKRHAAANAGLRSGIRGVPAIAGIGFRGNGLEGVPLGDVWEPTAAGAAASAAVEAAIAAAPPGAAPPHHNNVRGDIVLTLPGGETIVVDSTVTACVEILRAKGGHIHPDLLARTGAAAADAEATKTANYYKNWKIPKGGFYALGFEVLGAASNNVTTFIECVAMAAYPGFGPERKDYNGKRAAFKSMMRQLISVRLQTANAAAIKHWRDTCWNKAVPAAGAAVAAP